MKADALHLIHLRLPLRRAFASGAGRIAEREVILVGWEREGTTGWGEAAPYPGVTAENIGQTWNALLHRSSVILAGRPAGLPAAGAAAAEQAAFDWEARREGVPLWERLGGERRAVTTCAAVGLEETPQETCRRAEEAVRAGAGSVKIKVVSGAGREHLRAVRERFPDLETAADGNGSFQAGDPFLEEADDWALAYLEQPLPAADREGSRRLRARLATPLCLDESAHTLEGALRAAQDGEGDILSLKPGLLGIRGTLRAARAAEAAGMAVKIGGLVETSVGRAHALALAMRRSVVATDLMPARWLLETDVVREGLRQTNGKMSPLPAPGIGLEINEINEVNPREAPHIVRSTRISG